MQKNSNAPNCAIVINSYAPMHSQLLVQLLLANPRLSRVL